jgi:beta-galactosidase
LGHDGKENRRYREAAKVAREYQKLAPYLKGTTSRPQAAIIYDYDSIWALQFQPGYPDASHAAAIKRYYNALLRAGVGVDILRPGDDLSGYQLVLAPHLHVLADPVAKQLVAYVENGGVLLPDCRTGVKDETNLAYERTLPGLLSPALGIEIEEYESLLLGISDKETTSYKIRTDSDLGETFTAAQYADWVKPTSARTMARYDQPHLQSFAAVTRNEFGKGVGWYVGTIVSEREFYDKLIARLLADAKIQPLIEPPAGVEVTIRRSDDRGLAFVINHAAKEQTVAVPEGKRELLTNTTTDRSLTLAPFGVAIVELTANDLQLSKP